jgi:hypothetical protein
VGSQLDDGGCSDRQYGRHTGIPPEKSPATTPSWGCGHAASSLFAGFLLVLAYNHIIVSVRFNFAYDAAFNAMDKWILRGWSVSDLSHWALRSFPFAFFRFLELIYFGMFPQIGATIVIVSVSGGKNRGLQFVGTIFMAYYLTLGLFYLWPSHGPYSLCPGHFSSTQYQTLSNRT